MVAVLYAFLGVIFITLWRELKRRSQDLETYRPPLLSITLEQGADSKSWQFRTSEITFGRDPTCDCLLEEATVSARHARLYFRQGQWWVEDLQSTNGTFVNDGQVTTPLVLASGDQVRCGQAAFTITISEGGV
jgi:pSer/pThr/pTyr-binding forkhead associated (FHA) protein